MNPIQGINLQPPTPNLPTAQPSAESAGSFKDFMLESIGQVNQMQHDADFAIEQLATGGEEADLAQALTSIQKADMSFRMLLQIRNKLMQAYQDIQDIRI